MTGKENLWLMYKDSQGGIHYQSWAEVVTSGTMTDPETGEDMNIIRWTSEIPK